MGILPGDAFGVQIYSVSHTIDDRTIMLACSMRPLDATMFEVRNDGDGARIELVSLITAQLKTGFMAVDVNCADAAVGIIQIDGKLHSAFVSGETRVLGTELPGIESDTVELCGINIENAIIGTTYYESTVRPFVCTAPGTPDVQLSWLPLPEGFDEGHALAINRSGHGIGHIRLKDDPDSARSCLWKKHPDGYYVPVILRRKDMATSEVLSISDDGLVATGVAHREHANVRTGPSSGQPCFWHIVDDGETTKAGIHLIPTFGGRTGIARSGASVIRHSDPQMIVVGWSQDENGVPQAFVYDGQHMSLLSELIADSTVSCNIIEALHVDEYGAIWARTYDNQLLRLELVQ